MLVAGCHGAQERCAVVLCTSCIGRRPMVQEKAGALQGAFCSALGSSVEGHRARLSLFLARQRRPQPQQLLKGKVTPNLRQGVSYAAHADLTTDSGETSVSAEEARNMAATPCLHEIPWLRKRKPHQLKQRTTCARARHCTSCDVRDNVSARALNADLCGVVLRLLFPTACKKRNREY